MKHWIPISCRIYTQSSIVELSCQHSFSCIWTDFRRLGTLQIKYLRPDKHPYMNTHNYQQPYHTVPTMHRSGHSEEKEYQISESIKRMSNNLIMKTCWNKNTQNGNILLYMLQIKWNSGSNGISYCFWISYFWYHFELNN